MKSFIAIKSEKLSKACLSNAEGLTFSAFNKALRKKDVKINGKRTGEDVIINVGDKIDIFYRAADVKAYREIYGDGNVLVIYKEKGIESQKLFEILKEDYGEVYPVHRLDRDTDGVMILAKNKKSEEELTFGFKNRDFKKIYRAEVFGFMPKEEGVLEGYLFKDAKLKKVYVYDSPRKGAEKIKTGYKVIEKREKTEVLEVELFTGKTHQIRAHLAHEGHFIVGDGKYGNLKSSKDFGAKTQRLTAVKLTLYFPENATLYYLNGKTFGI